MHKCILDGLKVWPFYLALFFINASSATAQEKLPYDQYMQVVGNNHPIIQKANLFEAFAEAYELKGKGVLDPKLSSNYAAKQFGNTDYFRVWQSELKVPTRLPIDLSVGYDNNDGTYLNPENNVPGNGLIYGTINFTILRGLLFDEQRYNLQVADLKGELSLIEKQILTREIIVQASKTYLDWSVATKKVEVYERYNEALQDRHNFIIALYDNGDKAAIDTLESLINLNTASNKLLVAQAELIEKKQKLYLFLWDEDGRPMYATEAVKPEILEELIDEFESLALILDASFVNDPYLRKIENKIDQYELDVRLEREYLKPQLDLKYNTIVDMGKTDLDLNYSPNDYKYGVSFELPVRNRKVRGEIKYYETMVAQTLFDKQLYSEKLNNNYVQLMDVKQLLSDANNISQTKIGNSQLLIDAERIKFDLGESSVFMLNQRERKLLEAEIEYVTGLKDLGIIILDLYYIRLGQN